MQIGNENALMVLSIPHEHILNKDYAMIKQFFNKIVSKMGKKARQSAMITFEGYDSIPDEVYEIKAIREWVTTLFERYPYILYYIDDNVDNGVGMLLSCITDIDALYVGNEDKLSIDEYLRQGRNPHAEGIGMLLTIKVPKELFERIEKAILKHGKIMKDNIGARKVIDGFKERYFNELGI